MPFTLNDATLLCLNHLSLDGKFEVVMPKRTWLFSDILWTQDKLDMPGGKEDQFEIMYRLGTSAQYTSPGRERNPTFGKHFVNGVAPLIQMYFEVAYIEEEIELRGKLGPLQGSWAIVNYIEGRRLAEILNFYDKLEDDFLKLPILTGVQKSMWGLPYHITAITSAQMATANVAGAFQGGNPLTQASAGASAGSDWCGIDISTATGTYAGMQNYNFGWDSDSAAGVSMTEENKVRLAEAFLSLDFQGPLDIADLPKPMWNRYRFFTDKFMIRKFGIAARQQNDRMGADVLKYLGTDVSFVKMNNGVLINGLPIRHAPTLDTPDATDLNARGYHPFYGTNMDKLKIVRRPQKFMLKRPTASDKVHTPDVYVDFIDSVFNLRCHNHQQVGFNGCWKA